ncbi:ANTAR domain-containing protein [Mycobacterium colombiense]|uniref:ANTAR domain-containing protein n=1 Tax=Mycobacterium colombiense TaxID=339268 RepID=A0A329LKX2_9MYCO|nr:ANTAR domain-containing protein [Mycobacterium colombiense]
MGLGEPQRVGSFRFVLADQRWEWSDAVARMHGYEPGTMTPDTDLLISHKHPEDRERAIDGIKRVLAGEPFSSRHRIIDTNRHTHWVVVVGDRMLDDTGAVIGTTGFFVDVTETLQSDITNAVTHVAAARADIEQAKGVLMVTYGITAQRAFDILVWRSQQTNTKVRQFAQQFLAAMAGSMPPETQTQVDHILLTTEIPPK